MAESALKYKSAVVTQKSIVEIKGSVYTLMVLRVHSHIIKEIKAKIAEKIAQAPKFFLYAPMVIDCHYIESDEYPYEELLAELRQLKLIPVGFLHANEKQQAIAVKNGLGLFRGDPAAKQVETEPKQSKKIEPEIRREIVTERIPTKIVNQPVRSGQKIYAQGDLILLQSVSPGAEVLSDGNIHVYAALRGRALAGAKGDVNAQIFCQHFDAELVSIAGNYRVIDKLDDVHGKAAKVFLDKERLKIIPM